MGQKVNPNCFRIGSTETWQSLWYSKGNDYNRKLHQDIEVRRYITQRFKLTNISKIIITRLIDKIVVNIHSYKPNNIIGKRGKDIANVKQMISKIISTYKIVVSITEVKSIEHCPSLIAQSIAYQLKKKLSFRKVVKKVISNVIRLNFSGIKVNLKGRLGGIEIARSEWFREGKIPLHTLRFKVEYSIAEIKTAYGMIGVKVWIYKNQEV